MSYALYSSNDNEVIDEEHLVYDWTNMIGTLGGSLGLLIGFSFFDFISIIIDNVHYFRECFWN